MRNPTLHGLLQGFTSDAATRLTQIADGGDQVPFEVIETGASGRGHVPLYCYRALTGEFIRARIDSLGALASYAPAVRGLENAGGADLYLRALGESAVPDDAHQRADAALRAFVAKVFDERSSFDFDAERFEVAYGELERALYRGRCVTEVIASLRGLDLDPETLEFNLGDGLLLIRPSALVGVPPELVGLAGPGAIRRLPGLDVGEEDLGPATAPALLIVQRSAHEWPQQPPISNALSRFRRVLTALRLFEPGGFSIGPKGYARVDGGAWTQVAIGRGARPRPTTRIEHGQEDELRAFINLVSRRIPAREAAARGERDQGRPDGSGAGEVVWALARFEMGCERLAPFEALTDYLLGLRALLEPEGPATGRLAQRLAVICAPPDGQAELAERTARAISLERAVIAGLASESPGVDALVDELGEHLRAILRDVICGHLDADVRSIADELLAEAAQEPVASPPPFPVA